MAALRGRFHARALEEADTITGQLSAGAWGPLRDLSHGLSGRAGMFGFHAIGDAARAVEQAIDAGAAPEAVRALGETLVALLREPSQAS